MRQVAVALLVSIGSSPLLAAQPQWSEAGKRHLPLVSSTTRAVALADLDGDGDLDLHVGQTGTDRLLLNDGHGVFREAGPGALPADSEIATTIVTGDVDADGHLDLLVGSLSGLRLYINDGRARFQDATAQVPANLPPVADLELADLDRDGDLDIAAAHFAPSFAGAIVAARLYENDGRGTFRDVSSRLPQVVTITSGIALGDVDRDGDLDLVLANTPRQYKWFSVPGQELLWLNDGAGRFAPATTALLPIDNDATLDVALVDVDRDGDLDLLGMNESGNKLYRNDGRGAFTPAPSGWIPADPGRRTRLAIADVDGDGDPDFATAHLRWSGSEFVGEQNRLFRNDGSGTFTDVTASTLPAAIDATVALSFGDVDGDGDPDLIAGNDGQTDALLFNDGRGGFADALGLSLPADSMQATTAALGDVDGDGMPDLFLGSWGRGESRLFRNDGHGGFKDVTAQHWPGYRDFTAALLLADLDGDGDLDLVEGLYGREVVHRNDGRGRFTPAWSAGPSDLTNAMAVADVDGDGDLDLVTGNGGLAVGPPIQDRLYLNQGNLTFVDATARMPADQDFTQTVVAGDVDGDGDADLLFGTLEGVPRLYRNDGRGTFTMGTLPATARALALALGDVDGDGDLDLACGANGQPQLFSNVGGGAFVEVTAQAMPVLSAATVAITFLDFDEDGDLDLILANGGFPYAALVEPALVLRNDGTGVFADVSATIIPGVTRVSEIASGDVDGDGDRDLVLARFSTQSRLLLNTLRQQATPWLARPGRPFSFALHARDAGGSPHDALLFLGTSEQSPPLAVPPFGMLRVDPTGLVLAQPVAIPAGGTGDFSFLLPLDPSLTGVHFVAQSLLWPVGNPTRARLTNASFERVAPR